MTGRSALSITGTILFVIAVLGFVTGASAGFFKAGGVIQRVESTVEEHEKRLNALEAKLDSKADRYDVVASERRISEQVDRAVSTLQQDIREIRGGKVRK